MIRKIKSGIRKLIGLKNDTDYYSQAGEDAIVSKTFSYIVPKKEGFYVDIGAYHPFKHSNTYVLYKSGWRGLNIDPRPGSKALFDRYRNRDVNMEAGIAGQDGNMIYYMLDETSPMNTFSKENLVNQGLFEQVKKKIDIPVYRFDSLLKKHSSITSIDYLNIDAEGFEMEILSSVDFSAVTPTVISIEQNNIFSLGDVANSEVCIFLTTKGYLPYAKNILTQTVSTVFYIRT